MKKEKERKERKKIHSRLYVRKFFSFLLKTNMHESIRFQPVTFLP